MKFTETRIKMQQFSGAQTAEYQLKYLSQEVNDLLKNLNNKFVEHLTKDITETNLVFDFQPWLTNTYYGVSNQNAKDCLELCPEIKHIYGSKIKLWTDAALKCYDNFLLKYIQIDRNESIKKLSKDIKERDTYRHLIELGGELQEIGQAFDNIYMARNEFQHIQIVDDHNGKRIPRKITNKNYNQQRDNIIYWFKYSLILFIKQLKL
jgi:hypothetical protein